MRRRRSDHFENAGVAQSAEGGKQVAIPIIYKTAAALREKIDIKLRERVQLLVAAVSSDFARREIDRAFEMTHITFAQQRILQHRAKWWRDADRELERHAVVYEPLHHRDERDVTFRDRLEEPVFLEEFVVLRMTNEWQMRVKNEREMTHRETGNRKARNSKIRYSNLKSKI